MDTTTLADSFSDVEHVARRLHLERLGIAQSIFLSILRDGMMETSKEIADYMYGPGQPGAAKLSMCCVRPSIKDGLISQSDSEHDRRIKVNKLTKKGSALAEKIARLIAEI